MDQSSRIVPKNLPIPNQSSIFMTDVEKNLPQNLNSNLNDLKKSRFVFNFIRS